MFPKGSCLIVFTLSGDYPSATPDACYDRDSILLTESFFERSGSSTQTCWSIYPLMQYVHRVYIGHDISHQVARLVSSKMCLSVRYEAP